MDPNNQEDLQIPVAYDADGQPLYAHPTTTGQPSSAQPPTIVHMARSMDVPRQDVPPELQAKHGQSVTAYPQLYLSENEYVILSVRRHIIGLVLPAVASIMLISLSAAAILLYPQLTQALGAKNAPNYGLVTLLGSLVILLFAGGMYIVYWVYINNLMFLTNESIVEKTQLSLFSNNVKSVGLGDVVDVSYRQTGMIQQMLGYGTLQVGTKDDEVPYVFSYVMNPKDQASVLKDAVEAFKNGRPVGS